MAAPTLVELPPEETKRRYNSFVDEDKARAATLRKQGRSAAEAVQIVEAQNAAYMGQQPASEQARARGDVGEAELREAGAAALGAGQMLSMGTDKAVMDAWQWAKKHPVAAAYTAPFLPAAGALGLLGDDTEYRQQVEKIQQDAPGAAQRGQVLGILGDVLTGGGAAKQMGKAALQTGGKGVMRLLRAGAKPAAHGAASGFVGGAAGGEGGLESRLESGGKGAAVGAALGGAFGALPTAAAMTIRSKAAPSALSGIISTAKEAVQAAGGLGNLAKRQMLKKIPLVGDELADIAAPKPKVEPVKPAMVVESAPAAPVPEAPAGPVQMPPLPREARAVPLPAPAAAPAPGVAAAPSMTWREYVKSRMADAMKGRTHGEAMQMIGAEWKARQNSPSAAPSEALRIRKLGEENTWIGRALQHGVPPEQIAKGSGLPVEDVQAFAKQQRTNPEAGPTAADAPLPAPEPEPSAPSPFARAQSAQPEPTAANVPPGIAPERWQQLVAHYGKQPEPFLSSPTPRPAAAPGDVTAVGRTPKPPPDPVTNTAIPVTQSQIQASMTPEAFDIQKSALGKFDAVRRARQALEGTADVVGEQSPKWVDDVKAELRAKGANPAEIEAITDKMLTEGWDPHLVMQAIAARRGQELEGIADLSRLTGKTMKENLVAQAIASGAKDADEIADVTGLNLAEVELLAGRHNVLVPRGVPEVKPTTPTPINPAPFDESGERVFAPAYKEIFKEPFRVSKIGAEERLGRLPPGVGEGHVKRILQLRSGAESGGIPMQPQQIAERLRKEGESVHPAVVRFILTERGENMPRLSILKGGPEAPAFDEGAKVMARGREPGNVEIVKLLLNDKAAIADFLDRLRAAGWTEAQIGDIVSKASEGPKPLKVRKRKP